MILKTLNKLEKYKSYSPIFIRIIFLLYFILAVKAEVYTPSVIEKFAESLVKINIPAPIFFAYLGSWSVFVAYIMIIIGWKVRLAAIPVIIYFLVAVFLFHVNSGHGIRETMSATVLLVMGCFLLLNGAGKPSIDEGI